MFFWGASNVVHNGLRGRIQRYKCNDCGRRFDGGIRRSNAQAILQTDYRQNFGGGIEEGTSTARICACCKHCVTKTAYYTLHYPRDSKRRVLTGFGATKTI